MLFDRSTMNDDPDILVLLTTARTEFEASTIAESLRHEGIPSEVFPIGANPVQWESVMTNPIRVMVRRRDLQAAADQLRAIRSESIDIDWDEVNVGEPEKPSEAVLGTQPRRIGGFSRRMRVVRQVGGILLLLTALLPVAMYTLIIGTTFVIDRLRTFIREKKQNTGVARR